MSQVVAGMAVSLDGFVNDRNADTSRLYPNLEQLRELPLVKESIRTGAVLMGRKSYDMASGDFTAHELQTPLYIVTHRSPTQRARGENDKLKLHFITDGAESALAQARIAASDNEVTVVGGVSLINQLLERKLLDELGIGDVPVLLVGGLRLFEASATPTSSTSKRPSSITRPHRPTHPRARVSDGSGDKATLLRAR